MTHNSLFYITNFTNTASRPIDPHVNTEDEHNIQVADQAVTYYYNDNGEICAASAVAQNVHVYIGGSISESELEQIIASMN